MISFSFFLFSSSNSIFISEILKLQTQLKKNENKKINKWKQFDERDMNIEAFLSTLSTLALVSEINTAYVILDLHQRLQPS